MKNCTNRNKITVFKKWLTTNSVQNLQTTKERKKNETKRKNKKQNENETKHKTKCNKIMPHK